MSEPFLPYVHYGERVTGYWGAFWPLPQEVRCLFFAIGKGEW